MVLERDVLIEKLKLQIARMKRVRFGASSEQLDTQIMQLEPIVEDLESTLSAHEAVATTQMSQTHDAADRWHALEGRCAHPGHSRNPHAP